MTIYGTLLPGARTIAWSSALTDKLTEQAKHRIKILDWHKAHGKNTSLTARRFGIGRMTLHRWLKRFEKFGLLGLNEQSTKPKNVRRPASTVGRILKRKGLIDKKVSKKQMDTKYIMLAGGHKFYQFTAIDVLGKRRVLRVYPSQSSRNGALFLKECIASFPFPVQAVQTDNGSPFLK